MSPKVDKLSMSLDEIIRLNKRTKRPSGAGTRRRGSGRVGNVRNPRAKILKSPIVRAKFRAPPRNVARNGTFRTNYRKGNVESQWTHDLYNEGFRSMQKSSGGNSGKLIVSNLDYGVSSHDIEELFAEVGPLEMAEVQYDRSGRSLGTAEVTFEIESDAKRALKRYNGVPLDGRQMQITLATAERRMTRPVSNPAPRERNFRQLPAGRPTNYRRGGANAGRRGAATKSRPFRGNVGRGRTRGGLGGRSKRGETGVTVEALDKELEEYINEMK